MDGAEAEKDLPDRRSASCGARKLEQALVVSNRSSAEGRLSPLSSLLAG
jgi:hypothetical protein